MNQIDFILYYIIEFFKVLYIKYWAPLQLWFAISLPYLGSVITLIILNKFFPDVINLEFIIYSKLEYMSNYKFLTLDGLIWNFNNSDIIVAQVWPVEQFFESARINPILEMNNALELNNLIEVNNVVGNNNNDFLIEIEPAAETIRDHIVLCCENCLSSCTCSEMTPCQRVILFTFIIIGIGVACYWIYNVYTSS